MAETFRLRIYNKLPRIMNFWQIPSKMVDIPASYVIVYRRVGGFPPDSWIINLPIRRPNRNSQKNSYFPNDIPPIMRPEQGCGMSWIMATHGNSSRRHGHPMATCVFQTKHPWPPQGLEWVGKPWRYWTPMRETLKTNKNGPWRFVGIVEFLWDPEKKLR